MTKPIRAIEIIIATAVHGEAKKVSDVLLVPEDINEDDARRLMKMQRPRAKEAEQGGIKARLDAFKKEQAEREAAAEQEQAAQEENAKLIEVLGKEQMDAQAAMQEALRVKAEAKQMMEQAQAAKAGAEQVMKEAAELKAQAEQVRAPRGSRGK